MKLLSIFRYILFAVSLLGLFANLAQNEYGLTMLWYSDLFIAFIFWIEAFVFLGRNFKHSKLKAVYLFSEHFLVGIFFFAFFMKYMHWPGTGPTFVFVSGLLFILYLSYLIRFIIQEPKKGKVISLLVTLVIFATICSVVGNMFKTMHWPGAGILVQLTGLFAIAFIVMILIKKTFPYNGHEISFVNRLKLVPGKMIIVFCYFGFWGFYMLMVSVKIVPGFYSISRPPALDKMWQEKPDRAEVYDNNYRNFVENRQQAAEK